MSISALFAKLLPWSPSVIIFGRCLFAAPMVLLFLLWRREALALSSKKDLGVMVVLSALLILHWVTYYQSIQITTVALAIVCIWTHPIITTFLEPLLHRQLPKLVDVAIAILGLTGVVVLVEDFSAGSASFQGVAFGMVSAFAMSLRTMFSRHYVKTYSGSLTMFYQLLFGSVMLLPVFVASPFVPTGQDVVYLVVLAFVATAVAHTLVLSSLHQLTARASGILSVIQPVYGVALAYVVLQEVPSMRELAGCCIIILAVMIETVRQRES